MKKKKAFTLVELLIAMALVAVVGALMVRLLWIPSQAKVSSEKEFHVQSSLRVSSQLVNTSVRDASAVFLLTKEPPNNLITDLTPQWDYLICEQKDGDAVVVHYKWVSSRHERRIIAKAKAEEINFFINFEVTDGGKLLKYEILAKDLKTGREDIVSSELKPLNTFNITDNSKVDPSTGKKVGSCLALRNDIIDPSLGGDTGYELVTVSLVLDVSGSMANNMDGWFRRNTYRFNNKEKKVAYFTSAQELRYGKWVEGYSPNFYSQEFEVQENIGGKIKKIKKIFHNKESVLFDESKQRITILKKQANILIDRLMSSPNIDRIQVAIYPFSAYSYPRHSANPSQQEKRSDFTFRVLKESTGDLNGDLIKSKISNMKVYEGTNVGDGIRWAYYDVLDVAKANKSKRVKHFILVLTDGGPNIYSIHRSISGSVNVKDFFYGSGDSNVKYLYGSKGQGFTYMNQMANYVKNFPNDISGNRLSEVSDAAESIDATVIGFSNRKSDNKACTALGKNIGTQPGADNTYFITAGTEADLAAAFKKFSEKVLDKASLWYIVAPE